MTPAFADSILIVVDALRVCALVARTLSYLPYRLLTAESGCSATLYRTDPMRMLMVDFGLPDGNGLQIIKEARRVRLDLPSLLISGCGVAGVDVDFMLKPFDPDELLGRLKSMIRPSDLEPANS